LTEELIGLVPAAGKGVRLGLPYPKELYPVIRNNHYKPIAQYVLDSLTLAGLSHVVFVINETKHQLIGYFGDGSRFGCNMSYVVQEAGSDQVKSTSPGLAHALDSAYHLTRGKTVLFGMADTIMQPKDVFQRVRQEMVPEDDAAFALFATDRPEKFGMVRLEPGGRASEIVDKPRETNLSLMWGAIAWRPRFTEYLHEQTRGKGISDFALVMNNAIRDGLRFRGVPMLGGVYIDLGTYDEIMEMDRKYRED
jgi:glucose-1-phosphate thymidylyltransferase